MAEHEITQWEQVVASKLNTSVGLVAGSHRGEGLDDAAGEEMERIAEAMVAEGVERRLAVRASKRVFAEQSARDVVLAEGVVGAPAGGGSVMDSAGKVDLGDRLRSALSRVLDARDAKLELGCMFYAMDGHGPLGAFSMRQMAVRHGVSPEAVSVKVAEFQAELGLPKTAQQKSAAAVESYRRTNGAPKRARITK